MALAILVVVVVVVPLVGLALIQTQALVMELDPVVVELDPVVVGLDPLVLDHLVGPGHFPRIPLPTVLSTKRQKSSYF